MVNKNKLREQLTEVTAKIYLLEQEMKRLHEQKLNIASALWEAPLAPKFGLCRKCGEQTNEVFGGLPQCSRHISKNGSGIVSILEDLIYGS